MIKYVLIVVVFVSSKIYAQNTEFSELLSLFDASKKEIPLSLAKKYFNFNPTERSGKLFAGDIITKNLLMIVENPFLFQETF